MSNYLDNLIARNSQALEVVRPRLPSIFEPPDAMPFTAAALHATAPAESEQTPDENTSRPARQSEPNPVIPRREVRPVTETFSEMRMADPPAPAPPTPAWRGIQVIDEVTKTRGPQVSVVQDSSQPTPRPSDALNSTKRLSQATPVQLDEESAAVQRPAPEARRDDQPRQSPRVARENEAAPPADSADGRIVVRPRVSVLPQATRDEANREETDGPRSRRGRLASQPTAASGPTINVTIGRIEVKALPPAAAAPPPRKPAASLMSLDEYMRKRNAGGDSR